VAIRRAGGNDIQQQDRYPGVGKLRSDAGTHDAGADDCGFADRLH
jgi:hypothetical protein